MTLDLTKIEFEMYKKHNKTCKISSKYDKNKEIYYSNDDFTGEVIVIYIV